MSIIVQTVTSTGQTTACAAQYPTAQDVVDAVSTDLLQRIAPEDPVLLDYINRVQLQLLRVSRWKFLLSPLQRFITQRDRTDYWVGPIGNGPIDSVDTGLNLVDLGPIKTETFFDRSNFRLLKRTGESPVSPALAFRDSSSRAGPPRLWRNDVSTPCLINLYPAPDNQNNYQPVPEAPACDAVSGGALDARIYFVRVTFVDSLGNESAASDETRIYIPANNLLLVQPPQELPVAASGIQYNRYNVYVFNAGTDINATDGSETLATQSGPLSTSSAYTEPTTGFLTDGLSFPTDNQVEPLGGYLIEFRYTRSKPQVTDLMNQLLIPSDYFDVLVAGVNYFTAQFIKDQAAEMFWKQEYEAGKIGMIRDKNLFPRGPENINPDPNSQSLGAYYGYETIDQVNFPRSS